MVIQLTHNKKINKEVDTLSHTPINTSYGAIFTKKSIVKYILDLVGYTEEKKLYELRILEPAFGGGEFLVEVIYRLINSCKYHDIEPTADLLQNTIVGIEIHHDTYQSARKKIKKLLTNFCLREKEINILLDAWLKNGDFLLTKFKNRFDFVVGNPPYVRQEEVSKILWEEYKKQFHTIYDRADLYVPFIEHSLKQLKKKGTLGFICSDRWIKNRYGKKLRLFISEHFSLEYYINMNGINAFKSQVSAYPAIVIIKNSSKLPTKVIKFSSEETLSNKNKLGFSETINRVYINSGEDPWLLENLDQIAILRSLEHRYTTLEENGCKVGIGVATGADKVYIKKCNDLKVEQKAKLPIVLSKDINRGDIFWSGHCVANPFDENANLVNLDEYPLLKEYFLEHFNTLTSRYCAKKNQKNWYRTIDKIHTRLLREKKLLIPDISKEFNIAYDEGNYYPHHNLYYITSKIWDLKALKTILLSKLTYLFISHYSTKIRGGYLRFQAQYIRRIRLPKWESIDKGLQKELISACNSNDINLINSLTYRVYKLDKNEINIVENMEMY
jgi:hypothetical protein